MWIGCSNHELCSIMMVIFSRAIVFFLGVSSVLFSVTVSAQGRPQPGNIQEGRLYGKIIDASTRKPLEFAVIRVLEGQISSDSMIWKVITGALTEHNGDFSMDKIPTGRDLKIEVNFVGYTPYSASIRISASKGMGVPLKDAGNIALSSSTDLKEIEIIGETNPFRIEFDKRIYDVEKNPINEGGTAEDVLQNIPGVNVDVEGNVQVRNASPQIFVDGRPTNLTIDQIPADAIQRVEVITNPSARYDASGGGGGIINIVMKKNRSMGYSGSMRAGIDSRARVNGGIDFNVREGKINLFGGANYNQRRSISTGTTDRINFSDIDTRLNQTQRNVNDGYRLRANFGVDWFMDNRNTLTLNPSFFQGTFQPVDQIDVFTDTLGTTSDAIDFYTRRSDTYREFGNASASLLFKHLFADEGDELTADISYNSISSTFEGNYLNEYSSAAPSELRQTGKVSQSFSTVQMDYTNVIGDNLKVDVGIRAAVRDYTSQYENFSRDPDTGDYTNITALNVSYHYLDQVYAAYSNVALNRPKWKIQGGLRIESSDYRAELIDTTVSFRNQYPLSLFPSAFITRVISPTQDFQIAVNRRISRPSFFVLSPFIDYSDSLNVSRGNPGLLPEFTQTGEFSYSNNWNKNNSFIAALYVRYVTDLTVTHLENEYSPVLQRDVIVSTYKNATSSTAAGLELIGRNKLTEWFELTSNLNLYWSTVNGSNIQSDLTNSLSSWWFKMNATFKLPRSFVFQATGDYSSRRLLESGGTSRSSGIGDGGGGGPWNVALNTVQGYVEPVYGFDFSLKKDFLKDKKLSVSVSIRDAFRTRVNRVHSSSPFFEQDTFRRRDPQLVRMNVSWRFGKTDSSLFKRKNSGGGGEVMEG